MRRRSLITPVRNSKRTRERRNREARRTVSTFSDFSKCLIFRALVYPCRRLTNSLEIKVSRITLERTECMQAITLTRLILRLTRLRIAITSRRRERLIFRTRRNVSDRSIARFRARKAFCACSATHFARVLMAVKESDGLHTRVIFRRYKLMAIMRFSSSGSRRKV